MSDTELDVSSLGSNDEGQLVFPQTSDTGEEEEWEDAEEEEEAEEEIPPAQGAAQQPSAPFLVIPEEDLER